MSVWPEFDGIPFIILGRKIYGCHLGKDKDYGAKLKLRESRDKTMSQEPPKAPLRATKKLGCPAKISMVQIIKFPEYKVEQVESEVQRRQIFKKLHQDVNKDPTALKFEVRYYIKFSRPEDHSHTMVHFQIEETHRDSMDYRLVRHLCYLHHQGINRLSEMETALSEYVEETLYPSGDAPPKGIYPGLYPGKVAIQYHINNARCTEQLIHIDTKLFNKVVEEWRDLYPTHSFYYQAYIKEKSKIEQQETEHHYAKDMVEPAKLQSFMFCYQSDTQQRLLSRFGQNLAVLDTTKKRSQYQLTS
ncbi:uncharacterized protein [Amphiura filiformis]|uniref:uncharacterized protein isoform X3 n=1 Tax=Amphiura filiformis TaxID=82378 RepID=UPI003B21CD93